MKKIVTIAFFSFAMLLGMNTVQAQSLSQKTSSPEAVAKKWTADLSTALGLNGTQQRAVYRAMVVKESNYEKYITGKDFNNAEVQAAKKKHDAIFEEAMKKALEPEQYKKWKAML